MMKKLTAIRGATISENTPQDITKNVCDMCNEIIIKNKLKASDLVSIFFTVTKSGSDVFAVNDVMPVFRYGIKLSECECGIYLCGKEKLFLIHLK